VVTRGGDERNQARKRPWSGFKRNKHLLGLEKITRVTKNTQKHRNHLKNIETHSEVKE